MVEMEEDNDLEQVSGSPTAGESGFVHVEPIDSASMDGSSYNQDDGVVVTRVDTVQYEPSDLRMTEDGENEEFVDCPDDLVSYDERTSFVENMEGEGIHEDYRRSVSDIEREILPQHYQEERRELVKELTNLRHQLNALTKQRSLMEGNDGGLSTDQLTPSTQEGDKRSLLPLLETINECSKLVELTLNEQSQTEGTIRELYATLNMKNREIEDLNVKVNEQTKFNEVSSVEFTADRILSALATVFGEQQLLDTSVSVKMSHLEKSTSFLIENFNHFVSEVEMLSRCLAEVKSDSRMQTDMGMVLFSARDELLKLKRKEFELAHKSSYLEDEYRKLMKQLEKGRETVEILNAEIGKLKGEVELERTRCSNTKEKLNLAVTKGKSLVQQRDSLKQAIAEKTNEITRMETLANSLKEALSQRDSVLEKCGDILSNTCAAAELQSSDIVDRVTWLANERNRLVPMSFKVQKLTDALSSLELPEATQYPDLESQVVWLMESFNMAKDQSIKLQEIFTIKEAARDEIDRLTVSLLVEAQEKNYLKEEFEDLKIDRLKVSEELRALKDKNGSLQIDLQRSEDKTALLREKLSMAVKKGKALVQERDSLKQQMAEKNAHIEALKLELQQQEARMSDFSDQISKLSAEVEGIAKLESDLLRSKEERDQIEQFLVESNTILQRVIEAIDDIVVPVDLREPVEKVKWCAMYLNECQVTNAHAEQELGDVKDEASMLTSKLTDALTMMKSLKDALSVSEKNVSRLTEEKKRELDMSKTHIEREARDLKEEVASLNNKVVDASGTIRTLKNTVSELAGEKKNAEEEILNLNAQLSACKHDDWTLELAGLVDDFQALLKDGTLLTLLKRSFEKKFGSFIEMDHHLKDIKGYFDSEQLQDYPAIEENFQLSTLVPAGFDNVLNTEMTNDDAVDAKNIVSYVGKTLENLNLRNQILTDKFDRFSTSIDELIASLLTKLEATKNSLQQNVNNLQMDKQAQENRVVTLEHDIKVLLSACADFTKEIKFQLENNMREIDPALVPEKLNYNPSSVNDETVAEIKAVARNVRSVFEHYVDAKENMSAIIKELQAELEKTSLMYDKAKEENGVLQNRVFKLENELEVSQNVHDEMEFKLEDYREKEDKWSKREAELSTQSTELIKDHVAENALLLASDIKSLFNKINGITIPFPNIRVEDIEPQVSDPVKKLFYIVDSVNELSHDKEELYSILSKQALEVQHLKEELASKIKLLEEFNQSRTSLPENFNEKSVVEASSVPIRSEISEIEDPGLIGNISMPSVPYAAHVRTLRKGSNDHLAINIDPESDHLIDKEETVKDKGHIFKSLHTSGLVPVQGKMIADRLDGIWVSGSRMLMSRPRARLGLIAYWLVLHIWLMDTLL